MPTTHHLFAATWKPLGSETMNLSLFEKQRKFDHALYIAYTCMKGAATRMQLENPHFVFVAPEYYWIKDSNFGLFDLTEKASIYHGLRQSSAKFASVLLFPGTVNWKFPKTNRGIVQTASLKDKDFGSHNVCPVYKRGELLLEYVKKFNDGAVDSKKEAAFVPGPSDGIQNVWVDSLNYGVDICGDFRKGQLSMVMKHGRMLDVMVLTSGTMAHGFTEGELPKVPVHDGGAFIHCDNTGKADRNGVWALRRGSGWHGAFRDEIQLTFDDLDHVTRTIGFPRYAKDIKGMTMKVSAIKGFVGSTRDLDATITEKSQYAKKFSLEIPGTKAQTALIERGTNDYKVTLARRLSFTKVRRVTPVGTPTDAEGMGATGRGNVSKIGKLAGLNFADLACYYLPINK